MTSRWTLVALTSLAFGFLTFRFLPAADVQWALELYAQKLELVADDEAENRILVIGGSGTFFGVDARPIEVATGHPTLNLGVHAGMGINALTHAYVDHIRSGDLVVVIPEYQMLADHGASGALEMGVRAHHLKIFTDNPPSAIAHDALRLGNPGLRTFLRGSALRFLDYRGATPYPTDIDTTGNATHFPDLEPAVRHGTCLLASQRSLDELVRFQQNIELLGARLVVSLPWMQVQSVAAPDSACSGVVEQLHAANLRLLVGVNGNRVDDPRMFSDSTYHLTREGRDARSKQLGWELEAYLATP